MNDLPTPEITPTNKVAQNIEEAIQNWLLALTPETTLGGLPSYDVTVSPDVLTQVVDRQLGSSHHLPGIVVAEGATLRGMISRPTLLAQLSRPFGQELYLRRPIQLLLEAESNVPLVLPASTLVSDAAREALQRASDRVYEPVVIFDQNQFRLLDVHTLLIAQSRLLTLANETIRSQVNTAEAANQAKSLFLANMSHEIRTPLTAILGFAENLLDPSCSIAERTTATETILRNGRHLLQLINDILDLSKIEADRLEIERIRFSPGEVVSDVISALRIRAESKQIGLSLNSEGLIPLNVVSDPTRLRQILMNLISNGIKFTETGQVVVKMKIVDSSGRACSTNSDNQNVDLQVDVVDTGIGMSEEQLSRLFAPFMQADESMARRFGGTGLGLAISRRLAKLLGGDIVVSSQANVGSVFSLRIPVDSPSEAAWMDRPTVVSKTPQQAALPLTIRLNKRILLAEDGPDNQLLIRSFLSKQGADVSVVDNGRKAVDAAMTSIADGRPFDIVLMDMQMPILDGYSATRELRTNGWTRPILALTANVMQGDRQKCLEAGCNDFAAKPIDRLDLIVRIQTLINESVDQVALSASSALPVGVPQTDDLFDHKLALQRAGGDQELFREVAEILIQFAPEWLENLQDRLSESDLTSVRRIAHTLKNSADNVGGRIAHHAFSEIEIAAANGSLDEVVSNWPQCRMHFLHLIKSVEEFLGKNDKNTVGEADPGLGTPFVTIAGR